MQINYPKLIINLTKNFIFILLCKIIECKYILLNTKNSAIWHILHNLFMINQLIEYPLIIITHIVFILYIIDKKKNKIKNLLFLISVPLILLSIKHIIKKNIFILRPYNFLYSNQKNIIFFNTNKTLTHYSFNNLHVPIWLKKCWKEKNDSSFPSGHAILMFFWLTIIIKQKNTNYIFYITSICLCMLIIINRIIFYLHQSRDILTSYLINKIIIYIIKKYFKISKF